MMLLFSLNVVVFSLLVSYFHLLDKQFLIESFISFGNLDIVMMLADVFDALLLEQRNKLRMQYEVLQFLVNTFVVRKHVDDRA